MPKVNNNILNFNKILIFRTGHLGDTLVSLPAFWAVKNAFPNAEISLLTNSDANNPQYIAAKSILPEIGLFNKWLKYPTGLSRYKSIQAFKSLFREIKQENYDVLIYLMTRNRTLKQIKRDEIFFRFAGIKKIIGIDNLKNNLIDLNREKPLPKLNSELEFIMDCLPFENLKKNYKPDLLLSDAELEFAEKWMIENCGEEYHNKLLVGIAPASKWDSKVWAEDRFVEVGNRLIKEKQIFPIIFGGMEDKLKGNRLLEKWKIGANAAGSLNIRQAAAALEQCSLYLGNDTGTMHLAASVGTPCVAIFAAIDYPGRWKPFGDNHHVLRKTVECEGCFTPNCFNNKKCLDLISTDEVFQACLKILENE